MFLVPATVIAPLGTANAGCGVREHFIFAPGDGSGVPPNPSVLLFLPPGSSASSLGEIRVADASAEPLPATREVLKVENNVEVIRMAISAVKGTFTIAAGAGRTKSSATFHIRKTKESHATGENPPTDIVEVTYVYASGCVSSNGFIVHVNPKADAYRVSLGDKQWIVPDGSASYAVKDGHGVITSGSVGCEEFSIPAESPFAVEVTPVWADGEGDASDPFCRRIDYPPNKRGQWRGLVMGGGSIQCSYDGSLEFTGIVKRR